MMRKLIVLASAILAVAISSLAAGDDAQDARARFRKEMDSVYDYLPADVTQEVRNAKVKAMDGFWAFVASDLETYMPLLREALRDEKSNRYFLYDGSGLLVEHSKEPADWQLAADATARCRMLDVGRGYFFFCHHLASNGADCVPAVLQMLGDPKLQAFVPQHSLTLHQDDCVRLCLLAMDEDRWVAPLAKRLSTEKEPTAVATIVRCLADAVTPKAIEALRAVSDDDTAAPERRAAATAALGHAAAPSAATGTAARTREQFAAWLAAADTKGRLPRDAMEPASMRDARLLVDGADVAVLRSLRRKTARRISDEALDEIDFLTELLRRATAKGK